MSPQDTLLILLAAFPLLVLVAALKDAATYTIPNWISLALLAAFVPAAVVGWWAEIPLSVIGVSLAVGVAALLAGMGMFAMGWIGGGDAKLLAATALWLGLPGLAPFLFWTAMAGGALSMFLIAARRYRAAPAGGGGEHWYSRLLTHGEPIPYGLAIAVGALAAFPYGALTTHAL